METESRILIADDHPIFRQGLKQIIEAQPDFHVIAEAADGDEALRLAVELNPDIAVLDIDMPRMDGFEVARAFSSQRLSVQIVFLTMHKGEDMFNEAMNLGVKGYIVKDSAVTDITGCLRAVLAGQHFLSPTVSSYLVNRSQRAARLESERPGLRSLTPTERRIVSMIAENKTSREISDELFVSLRTVENHRANICHKLGLHGAHALLKFALEHRSDLA